MSDSFDIASVYNKISFVSRYQAICESHDNLKESFDGNSPEKFAKILVDLGYKAKYYKSESFFKIVEKIENFETVVQLVLKNGLVEVRFYALKGENYGTPAGRLDFLALKLDSNFDRKKYNLPKYKDENELLIILKKVFDLYEDFKLSLSNL